jgi:hypothetical protein
MIEALKGRHMLCALGWINMSPLQGLKKYCHSNPALARRVKGMSPLRGSRNPDRIQSLFPLVGAYGVCPLGSDFINLALMRSLT